MYNEANNSTFWMEEPREHGTDTRYAFRMETQQPHHFHVVRALMCVRDVRIDGDKFKGLVEIDDDFDADEAWHYIHAILQEEARLVKLDKIWEEAMWVL